MVPEMESGTKRGVVVIVVFLLAILSLLSIFDLAGGFGRFFYGVLKLMFGWGFWIFPLVLLVAGYLSLRNTKYSFAHINWVGMFLLIIGYSGFFHLTQDAENYREIISQGVGGGYIGLAIAWPLFQIMGRWAGMAVSLAIFLIGALLMFNTSIEGMLERITLRGMRERVGGWFGGRDDENYKEGGEIGEEEVEFEEKEIEGEAEEEEEEVINEAGEEIPRKRVKRKFPKIEIPLSLLNDKAGKPAADDIKRGREIIRNTLANFSISVEMGDVEVGPTVTQYTFRPAEGVKLSRIIGLGNDLALALAAHPIRIEAPIPGKSLVGVEVPNKKNAIVPLRHVLETKEFKERKTNLDVILGQDVAGKPWIVDLGKLPHLLVAGQTGSGKTVCLNSLIVSLLYQNQPDELKLILVDPKRVEMPVFNGIPYLMTPVITDVKKTINALKWTTSEMERRFHVLSNAGKRNIQSYNATHPSNKLPYLIFIIDELADLMSVAGAEVEAAVIRLAQMSRAVGIHLVLATQRPSVDIITGLIKANIPGRIAFAVASLTDSRTILDMSGAEKLLGSGDMLFTSSEVAKPKRLQGAYCSDGDIERVVEFLRDKAEPDYKEDITEKSQSLGGVVMSGYDGEGDDLLEEARELVVNAGKASASYLQRMLKIGYARAARILDLLESQGVIGPADGAKPRDILVKKGERSLVEQADTILEEEEEIDEGPEIEEEEGGIEEDAVEEEVDGEEAEKEEEAAEEEEDREDKYQF